MKSIVILTGPTASGKTAFALEMAERLRAMGEPPIEIINADSILVYRGFDIGSAKPGKAELARVTHHLIDCNTPEQPFTAGDFAREARAAIAAIEARGARPLIVGGTGFYLKALVHGMWGDQSLQKGIKTDASLREKLEQLANTELYSELRAKDARAALKIGPNDRYRLVRAIEIIRQTGRTPSDLDRETSRDPDPRFDLWWIDREPEELEKRIRKRTSELLARGFVDEVRGLLKNHPKCRALKSVGYAQVVAFLNETPPEGRVPRPGLAGLEDEIVLATRQMVRRQRNWFRGQTKARRFVLDADRAKLESEFLKIYATATQAQ